MESWPPEVPWSAASSRESNPESEGGPPDPAFMSRPLLHWARRVRREDCDWSNRWSNVMYICRLLHVMREFIFSISQWMHHFLPSFICTKYLIYLLYPKFKLIANQSDLNVKLICQLCISSVQLHPVLLSSQSSYCKHQLFPGASAAVLQCCRLQCEGKWLLQHVLTTWSLQR